MSISVALLKLLIGSLGRLLRDFAMLFGGCFRDLAMLFGAAFEKNRVDFRTFLVIFHTFQHRLFPANLGGFDEFGRI